MADKNKVIIRILILIIVLLALAVLYAFALRPAISGYVVDKQVNAYNQGYIQALDDTYTQLNQAGYAQFSLGDQILVIEGQSQLYQIEESQ